MKLIEDPKLLELRFSNGMLILPYYHSQIIAHINNQHFSKENAPKIGILKSFIRLFKGIRGFKIKKSDIIGFSSTRWNVLNNGKWRNIQHGPYYNLYPQQFLLVEDWDVNYKWRTLDSYPNLSTVVTFIRVFVRLFSIVSNKVHHIERDDFNYISSYYPFITKKRLSLDDYYVRYYAILISWLIKKVQPKIALQNCGSYGNVAGIFCKVAKHYGVITIDTQHAQVYQHKAYVASDVVRNSREYMEYMPDYLYCYGDYWAKCVDWKYEKVVVGNPFLNEYVNKYSQIKPSKDFLVISQPDHKKLQHDFVKKMAGLYRNSIIYVRLHPVESLKIEKEEFHNFPNIVVTDSTKNLYEDMCEATIVVGWCSTCLSELLAFRRVPYIVKYEASIGFFPHDIGRWIKSPEEMKGGSSCESSEINAEEFWYSHFDIAAKTHLDSLLKKFK